MPFIEWKTHITLASRKLTISTAGYLILSANFFNSRQYGPDGKYFILTLNKFAEYAQVHFSTEERYMQEAHYPKFAEHQNEHELFIAQLSQLAQDVENKEADIENKTLDFLKDWYVAHILGADRDLEKSFQAKGFK